MRIAICDPHTVFAESLAYLLRGRGCVVLAVVDDLGVAIEAGRKWHPDILLTDTESAADQVAGLHSLAQSPDGTAVVLLADRLDQRSWAIAMAVGARGVAAKSSPLSQIVDILARVAAGETVLSQQAKEALPHGAVREYSDRRQLAQFLTEREREVLGALVCGEDTGRIARRLLISQSTTRCHIQSVLTKMDAHSRLEVAAIAVREGLVNPTTGQWQGGH